MAIFVFVGSGSTCTQPRSLTNMIIVPCRFAYVEFGSKDEMTKATELDGSDFNGRNLTVNEASQPSGGGGASGGRSGGRGGFGGRGGDRGGRGFGGRGGGRGGDRGESHSLS